MRNRPSMVPPSTPYMTCPAGSLNTATFTAGVPLSPPPRTTMPMNFNGIGGNGGGGGGPVGSGGVTGSGFVIRADGGGTGGALGWNRNRLRSVDPGFGFCSSSACRCTSGAVEGAGDVPGRACPDVAAPARLDAGAVGLDGPVHIPYTTNASPIASAPSTIRCRRSGAIGPQAIVGGELDVERQRLPRLVLRQRHIVDDQKLRRAFHVVDEAAQRLVVALQRHVDFQPAHARAFRNRRIRFGAARRELHVRLLGERGERRAGLTARIGLGGRQNLAVERRELLGRAPFARDQRLRRGETAPGRAEPPRPPPRPFAGARRLHSERVDPECVRHDVQQQSEDDRNDERPVLENGAFPERRRRHGFAGSFPDAATYVLSMLHSTIPCSLK